MTTVCYKLQYSLKARYFEGEYSNHFNNRVSKKNAGNTQISLDEFQHTMNEFNEIGKKYAFPKVIWVGVGFCFLGIALLFTIFILPKGNFRPIVLSSR